MIRAEIERLEKFEEENSPNGEAPPQPPVDSRTLYGIDMMEDFDPRKQMPLEPEQKSPPEESEPLPDDIEELSEDMADWDFEEDDDEEEIADEADEYEDEEEYDDYEDSEFDEDNGYHGPQTGTIKIDHRSGVVDYNEIKEMDFSRAQVMDAYKHAEEVGLEGDDRRRRRKPDRRKRRERVAPRKKEVVKKELTEAEKLVKEMESDLDEKLDLEEMLIPDVPSTLKSKELEASEKKAAAEILWEADEEDKVWLQKRFLEEVDALKERRRLEAESAKGAVVKEDVDESEVEDWRAYKLVGKKVTVEKDGKKTKERREIWKVKEGRKKEEGRRRAKKEEGEKEEKEEKEEKKEEKKEKGKPKEAVKGKKRSGKPKGKAENNSVDWD
jgi:hypothetical protein